MIPIARPLVGKAEAEAAHAVVLAHQAGLDVAEADQRPQVAAFEREFAAAVGAAHACAVAN